MLERNHISIVASYDLNPAQNHKTALDNVDGYVQETNGNYHFGIFWSGNNNQKLWMQM